MWQALHEELKDDGLTVVTVALDVNAGDAAPWIALAEPTHPSVIDSEHSVGELFGINNVPMAVWIDETGHIVRPAELASIEQRPADGKIPEELPERIKQVLTEVGKFQGNPEGYLAAIHDWVANGKDSAFALSSETVVSRSAALPYDHAAAAACFALGQWHWDQANNNGIDQSSATNERSVYWWSEAHRLDPQNWTYKRQAWTLETTAEGELPDLLQGATERYEGNWFDDLMEQGGGENYYQAPEL